MRKRRLFYTLIMLLICIVQISGCAFKSEEKMKQDITDIAEQNEYSIEFINDKEFVITQDEVKYYYKCGITVYHFGQQCGHHVCDFSDDL